MTFKYIELFSGIGGFRSALDPLGGECVFASEIDPFATRAYKALYGGATELHGDITKIDAKDVPDHDLLVGGFPCQAFSVAGQRKGFDDTRGTLFFEIARIAQEKRPKMMLLENVKGLLSHDKGRTIEVMAQALNDIGYAIDFRVLNSKFFGVPHNRERIFIACDCEAEHEEWNITGKDVVARAKRRIQAMGVRTFNFDWPDNGEVIKRLRDILEDEVDQKYYLSEEKTAKLVAQLNEKTTDDPVIFGSLEHYGNDQMNRVYSVEGLSPTITVVSGGGREQKIAEPCVNNRGVLTTIGEGISNTLDANYAKGLDNHGQRTHVLEPFTVIQKTHSTCTTVKYDETGTLQAARLDKVPQVVVTNKPPWIPGPDDINRTIRTSGKSSLDYKHNCDYVAEEIRHVRRHGNYPRYRIRKLTPRECWRLQGFLDAQFDKARSAGVSDSQLYKQAGNAVTVNVISAIGKRLIPLLHSKVTYKEAV